MSRKLPAVPEADLEASSPVAPGRARLYTKGGHLVDEIRMADFEPRPGVVRYHDRCFVLERPGLYREAAVWVHLSTFPKEEDGA